MKRTSRNRLPQIGLLALALCLLLAVLAWRSALASVAWRLSIPLLSLHTPFSALGAQFIHAAALERENETLRAELASTTASLADRNLLYQETISLKARLGRDIAVRSVLAGIVMRPPGTPYDVLMIDAGRAQGVSLGDYVSAGGTTIIGTIDEAYQTSARVKLLSAPEESYQGLLSETTQHPAVPLTVVGQGGNSLTAQVPAKTLVIPGDAVVLPGIANGYSGIVSHVDVKNGDSFETLYLQLPVDPQELQYVEVLLQ
jgi:cell shape-determining protein MreC